MEFSRTAPLEDGISAADQVAQEIRRTLLSYGAKTAAREIGQIILAGEGPDATVLATAVGLALDRSVTSVGPGTLETATAAGVCAGLLRGTRMPDLLHPPVELRKFTLTQRHRIVGMVGLVAVLLFAWSQIALGSKRAELDKKRAQLDTLKPRAAALMRTQSQTQLANQWYKTRNCYIDTLAALRQNVNTNSLWIVNASFEDPGLIRLQGKARDDGNVTDFVTSLKNTGKFGEIKVERVDTNKSDSSTYRKDFTINAQLAGIDLKKKKNMTDKRTQILAIVALSALGLFLLDKAVSALVTEPWTRISQDLVKTEAEIRKAGATLNNQEAVARDWAKVRDRLDLPRTPDVHTHFLTHLGDLFEKFGVAFDVSENPQPQQQGDFKEYIFDTKFKLTWAQFVDLLVELHNSREFVKPLRMSVGSQYEKEDRLDLELKLSTIEYFPAPVKAGEK